MRHLTKTVILLLAILVTLSARAQVELGLNMGLSLYEGDLSAASLVEKLAEGQASIGAYGRVDVGERLAFRGYVQSSKIRGTDANRPSTNSRNLNFRNKIFEIGVMAEIYPLGTRLIAAPYLQAGASVYHHNPETEYNGRWVEVQPLGTEGQGMPGFAPKYALTRFAIPIGIGVRHNLGEHFVVGAQANARLLFFDHLDDVSGNYVNYYSLLDGRGIDGGTGNGSLAAALGDRTGEFAGTEPRDMPSGTRRGDPTNNDWFYTATITIGYRIGSGLFGSGNKRGGSSRYNKCYQF